MRFETFLAEHRPRLTAGLVASYGPEVGQDAAAEAVAYGWQHWDRLQAMENPVGYLYRVGQTSARSTRRPGGYLPPKAPAGLPEFEPGLAPALESLSDQQRACVILVFALGWSKADAARLLDLDVSTVRTHINRGLDRLPAAIWGHYNDELHHQLTPEPFPDAPDFEDREPVTLVAEHEVTAG